MFERGVVKSINMRYYTAPVAQKQQQKPPYLRRAAEAESDGAHERRLSRPVRPHDHVQARSEDGLGVLVHQEVLELEANDGALFPFGRLFRAGP